MGLAVKLDLLQQKGLEVEITGSRDLWIGDAELLPGKRKELGESNFFINTEGELPYH